MKNINVLSASSQILRKAKQLGATLAGFAHLDDVQSAPSFTFVSRMRGFGKSVGTRQVASGREQRRNSDAGNADSSNPGQVGSILVIAVDHPIDRPEMDWWYGHGQSLGNRIMAEIMDQLCVWITASYDIRAFHLPYHPQGRGTFLKDASVLAGLGCIGKNNLLVTPEYGPRVRLRALTLDMAVPSTGITGFDPCSFCEEMPCRSACPQGAFDHQLYTAKEYHLDELPGRTGLFSRLTCNIQMEKDMMTAKKQIVEGLDIPVRVISYCRKCELACPVGN